MDRRLVCYACGRDDDYPSARCSCGEPLWFDIDPPATWPRHGDDLWRYADWLPVSHQEGLGAIGGGTPLVRADRLKSYAGCRPRLKVESVNPTGSFKDRGSAVGLAGTTGPLGTVSHGNMAVSMAAHAAGAGRNCLVLVPADISDTRLSHIARYEPTIARIDGDYGALYSATLEQSHGISFVNSDTPLRVAGQKTVALEICETYAPGVPDTVVLPVSSGGHASGVWKALRELRSGGLIDSIPQICLVQAAACDPIAAAFRADRDEVTPVDDDETIAYSIANANPPSGNRALAAVDDTGGVVVSVDDQAIREAQTTLARTTGYSVEAASAAALAGLRQMSGTGVVSQDDDVTVILTGTGFREPVEPPADVPTWRLDQLSARLRGMRGEFG